MEVRIGLPGLCQLLLDPTIVVMDEQPDGPIGVIWLLGKRQGLPDQSLHPLPQGVVKPLSLLTAPCRLLALTVT